MLPFAPGITGYYIEQDDKLSIELRSLRNLRTVTFTTKNTTVINTIKSGFSLILEDYLGDSLPGFSDAFFKMIEHPIPVDGEEREFEVFDGVKMKFCWIPAGEAQLMGPTQEERDYNFKNFWEDSYSGGKDESVRGIHKTNGFWMGKYEVTQAQWEAVMGENPSHFKGGNLPVERVSWDDCQEFIKKCSVSGLKVQLPHEDQWEYACRGGKGNKQAFYWGDAFNGDKANCDGTVPYGTDKKGTYLEKTTEVGGYEKIAPHPWSLCDMHGNVWEWCDNLYAEEELYLYMVTRGGGWSEMPYFCRSSYSNGYLVSFSSNKIGFRLIIC